MIKLLCKIPDNFYVAVSGGQDSMVALHFLKNHKGFRGIIHCNHGTNHSDEAYNFLKKYCNSNMIRMISYFLSAGRPKDKSIEQYWHEWRKGIFNQQKYPVITAHHLGDAVEWWLMSSFHGQGKLIPTTSGNVIRPFLTVKKSKIQDWTERKCIKFIEDPSNYSRKYDRNLVRHDIIPLVKNVNPGIEKVISKKYFEQMENKANAL